MKRTFLVGGAALSLALAACGGDAEPEEVEEAASRDEGEDEAEDTSEPEEKEPAEEPKAAGITSEYTKYNLDDCEVLSSEFEEGESLEAKCDGYKGVPLFVNVGDGRFDIDVGVGNPFHTISPFNELNDTIEWRLKDGEPFAVIARLKDVSMESGGNSALMVETVGAAGNPGCRIAHVWNSNAAQNQTARDIADASLQADFECPAEPRSIR